MDIKNGSRGSGGSLLGSLRVNMAMIRSADRRRRVYCTLLGTMRPVKLLAAAIRAMHIPRGRILSDSHFTMGTRCISDFPIRTSVLLLRSSVFHQPGIDSQNREVHDGGQPLLL
jgi:hypothetical protein